jgi:molybdopterin-guanine dinucleotide biosynthesis protein A
MPDPNGSILSANLHAASLRLPITAAVLAGGRSRRMGTDKALVSVGGVPLVTRAVSPLASACARVLVVVSDPGALAGVEFPPGTSVITDSVAFQGPLGGLASALAAAETDWVFAVGVDMPFVRVDVLRMLWAQVAHTDSREDPGSPQAVMPMSDEGPQPLLSLYRVDCLGAVQSMLAEGSLRVADLRERVRVLDVPMEMLQSVDPELLSVVNVNTAEDLAHAQDLANARASQTKQEGVLPSE